MLSVPLCSANLLSSCLILIISVPEMFSINESETPPELPAVLTTFIQQGMKDRSAILTLVKF